MSTTHAHDRALTISRIVSAVMLLAAGAIHLFLVIGGAGGLLGVAFALNFVAGLVLGIGMLVVPRRFLLAVTALGLAFMVASLGAIIVSITVGLLGVQPDWDYPLIRETAIIEAIGVVVLVVALAIAYRERRARLTPGR
jgi:hypothetical protein